MDEVNVEVSIVILLELSSEEISGGYSDVLNLQLLKKLSKNLLVLRSCNLSRLVLLRSLAWHLHSHCLGDECRDLDSCSLSSNTVLISVLSDS